VNHNGDAGLAHQLVEAAKRAGADAVKFQMFKADRLVTLDCPKAGYQAQTTGLRESQYAMLKRLELPDPVFHELAEHCQQLGIQMLVTPFDEGSADALECLNLPGFKIASGELTNHLLLAHIAAKGRPIILSTGMADLAEVAAACAVIRQHGNPSLVLMHCVSQYPAAPADCNLRAMQTLRQAFGVPVGFSDHTLGIQTALAAVALGAAVIEKHFTLDRSLPGPDHQASATEGELQALVKGIRDVEAALGDGVKRMVEAERDTAAIARRSLCVAADLAAGTVLTREMIIARRSGTGLAPALLDTILGRRLGKAMTAGEALIPESFQ
jgi:N-acetylneuraminate synthase/N,N'-diacetyllegionaminate synthase